MMMVMTAATLRLSIHVGAAQHITEMAVDLDNMCLVPSSVIKLTKLPEQSYTGFHWLPLICFGAPFRQDVLTPLSNLLIEPKLAAFYRALVPLRKCDKETGWLSKYSLDQMRVLGMKVCAATAVPMHK